ncbi:MAG: hypothetical protein P4L26_08285 [Terracidiphilus sp.]|nr:hypothetical protein [Terracidiphilus sp.]
MPLFASGLRKIRRNLLRVQSGQKPWVAKVGFFTAEQIAKINEARVSMGFPALLPEILFHGSHLYVSRCVKDNYTIDQVLEQIESALGESSVVDPSPPAVVLRNPNKRFDHKGNPVNDKAVFECSGRQPYADLYSVIPDGDGLKEKPKRR